MGYNAGVLALFYKVAIGYGVAPLIIFMGVGAMTDFGPLLANPRTLLLGAAAQFGILRRLLAPYSSTGQALLVLPCHKRLLSVLLVAPTVQQRFISPVN